MKLPGIIIQKVTASERDAYIEYSLESIIDDLEDRQYVVAIRRLKVIRRFMEQTRGALTRGRRS
jgi:hypothetical protein